MSKIVITSPQNEPTAAFIGGLSKIIGAALPELRSALHSGAPVFEGELFQNNHEEVARQIRDIGTLANKSDIRLNYYEIQPDEDFAACPHEECEISVETVENILIEWEARQL